MNRLVAGSLIAVSAAGALALTGSTAGASAQATTIDQKRAFGTVTNGATVCVGPLSPSDANGVQIFGFTNATPSLTWQVLTVSSQSAPTVVFQTTARSVSRVVPPSGNLMFEACAKKTAGAAQDFDLTLNSQALG
ncbi:hypothetical protein [Krasilnikovia sp. MM14-A1004]|uniref:hypothetical protein n=1 Tax=Krasilnikovia sp. MM14-A1004 TaxID=3373541 RepID=UPI00399D1B6C